MEIKKLFEKLRDYTPFICVSIALVIILFVFLSDFISNSEGNYKCDLDEVVEKCGCWNRTDYNCLTNCKEYLDFRYYFYESMLQEYKNSKEWPVLYKKSVPIDENTILIGFGKNE